MEKELTVYDEKIGEVVNTTTGEIIETPQVKKTTDLKSQMLGLIPTAGTVTLTDKQKEILYAKVDDNDVEIRPDGLIYLPWMEYVSRLRDAFGLSWAIIPNGEPKIKDNLVLWGYYLIIQGKLAGYAIGEQQYQQSNAKMTWGDACEGATSNALMRLCKRLGISLELWRPSFVRRWKDQYAESYWSKDRYNKPKLLWKRKTENADKSSVSLKSQQGKEGSGSGLPNGNIKDSDVPLPSESPESQPSLPTLSFGELEAKINQIDNLSHLRNFWKKYRLDIKKLSVNDKHLLTQIKEQIKDTVKKVLELKKEKDSGKTSKEMIDEAFGEDRIPGEEG